MDGFGAMISFGVSNRPSGGDSLMNHVRLITRAVSLGGLGPDRASGIHDPCGHSPGGTEGVGISDELIRLSVGCEDFEDLRDDVDQALRQDKA